MRNVHEFDYESLFITLRNAIPDSIKTLKEPLESSVLSDIFSSLGVVEDFGLRDLYEWKNGQIEGEPGLLFGMRFLPADEIDLYLTRINGMKHRNNLGRNQSIPLFSDFGGNYITIGLDYSDVTNLGKIYVEGRDYEDRVFLSQSLNDFMRWFQNCIKNGNFVYIDHGHGFGELNLKSPSSTHMLDVLRFLPIPLN